MNRKLDSAFEIVVIDRRQFLRLAGGALISIGTLNLLGCGGSGGGTGVGAASSVSGNVGLPSGSSLQLTGLSVQSLGTVQSVKAGGSFSAPVASSSPTLALVVDKTGTGVLTGFLEPGVNTSQSINAQSTAVVLVFLALGGPMMPAASKSATLQLLNTNAAVATFAAVIAKRIAANPYAVAQADSQIITALNTALAALTGTQTDKKIPVSSSSSTPLLTLTPSVDQSGISVNLDNTIIGVDVLNHDRRPLSVYVYEVDKIVGGVDTAVSPAKLTAGPFFLQEATDLTVPISIGLLTSNPSPYKVTSIPAIPLALDGAADQTTYEIVVIGPSLSGTNPAFFQATRYAQALPGWITEMKLLYGRALFVDITFAIALEVLGFGSVSLSAPNLNSAIQAMEAASSSFFHPPTQTNPSSAETQFLSDITGQMSFLLGSKNATKVQQILSQVTDQQQAQAITSAPVSIWDAIVNAVSGMFTTYFTTLFKNANLIASDLAKVISELNSADPGVLWTAVVAKNEIQLSPAASQVSPGDLVKFTITLSPDLTGTYTYVWSQSSNDDVFSAVGETNTGNTITTQKLAVNLQTSPTDTAPNTITVVAYDTSSGHRVEIGTAAASVDFVATAVVSPANPILAIGAKQVFQATAPITLPSGVKYLWDVTGTSGTIGVGTVTTTTPSITYTAQQDGVDGLTVQIVDSKNNLLAKGGTQITVGVNPVLKFAFAGDFGTVIGYADGSYNYAGVLGDRETLTDNNNNPIDRIFLTYDVIDNNINSQVLLWVPVGAALTEGEKFTYGLDADQTFSVGINNPTAAGSPEDPVLIYNGFTGANVTGTLTCTAVSTLSDGTNVVSFTFSFTDPKGGTFSGSGTGTWK